MFPVRRILYNLALTVAMIVMLPHYLVKMRRRGGYAHNFGNRFGRYDADTLRRFGDGGAILVHAVSVGEVGVAWQFIQAWRKTDPSARFVISTTSSTGYREALKRVGDGDDAVIYNPLDLPCFVRRALDAIRPAAFILVETEIWPNLLAECEKRAIPVCLVNGRLSDRTAPTYRRLRFLFGPAIGSIRQVQVQSDLDAERYIAAGAEPSRTVVTGSFKFDVARRDEAKERAAGSLLESIGFGSGHTMLLGASTWPGEETLLCKAYLELRRGREALRLVLVPRHMERAGEVCSDIRALGLTPVRKTDLDANGTRPLGADDVLVVDTTGEMMGLYPHAAVCVVGRTFRSRGGQNMIEPCLCGVPTVVGPQTQNFRPVMADLLSQGAIIQVADDAGLVRELGMLLGDEAARRDLGEKAARAVASRKGAVDRCVAAVRDAIR